MQEVSPQGHFNVGDVQGRVSLLKSALEQIKAYKERKDDSFDGDTPVVPPNIEIKNDWSSQGSERVVTQFATFGMPVIKLSD